MASAERSKAPAGSEAATTPDVATCAGTARGEEASSRVYAPAPRVAVTTTS
jgi:hypothetical protein